MARQLLIVWAGRHQRDRWEELISDYRTRIERTLRVRELTVKVARGGSERERRTREEKRLIEALPADCWSIALDSSGEMLDSVELARRLGSLIDEWPGEIAFVVGSDVGLGPGLLSRARQVLSLGPMTLPHELARLVLYEQLYRAMAIRAGINYHR